MTLNKKVKLQLAGLNGNAFALMGAFSRQARRENWTSEEIEQATKEMMEDDYNHLLRTLMKYTYVAEDDEDEEEEDEDDEEYDDEEEGEDEEEEE